MNPSSRRFAIMMFRWPLVALTLVSFALPGLAQTVQPRPDLKVLRFDPQAEVNISLARILENLNHSQISRGAVIASPSQRDPDYFFHWVRDAGLTMGALIDFAHRHPRVPQAIQQWSLHERTLQNISSQAPGGLGEPKFHVDGRIFSGPWGRPQNDGPAIRAWATLKAFGVADEFVLTDLEYLRREWMNADFDLWEEVRGHHFFTRYAQMTAFRSASIALMRQQRRDLAQAYAHEAARIESTLPSFIDTRRQTVTPTLPGSQGVQKHAGVDVSVILAMIYFGPTSKWSVSQSYVLATAHRLEQVFTEIYPINKHFADMAPAIGRYPEDVYDGNGFSGGHPWYLATFGMAEFYCQLVEDLARRGSLMLDPVNLPFFQAVAPDLTQGAYTSLHSSQTHFWDLLSALQTKAESFISRALFHGGTDRHFAEQFDRHNGYRRGARDLTWSYASHLRAIQRCQGTQLGLDRVRRQHSPGSR